MASQVNITKGADLSGDFTTASSTFVDTGVEVSVTPGNSSAKILINFVGGIEDNTSTNTGTYEWQVVRDSTVIAGPFVWNDLNQIDASNSVGAYDAPGDTTEHTYKLQLKQQTGPGEPKIRDLSHFIATEVYDTAGGGSDGQKLSELEIIAALAPEDLIYIAQRVQSSSSASPESSSSAPDTYESKAIKKENIAIPTYLHMHTSNGFGSTNSRIRRMLVVVKYNDRGDFIYRSSETLGDSIEIRTPGVYSFSFSDNYAGANQGTGLTLNSTQLSTALQSVAADDRLCFELDISAQSSSYVGAGWEGLLEEGDIVRLHCSNGTGAAVANRAAFTVVGPK